MTAELSSARRVDDETLSASKVTSMAGVRPYVVAVHVPVARFSGPAAAEEDAETGGAEFSGASLGRSTQSIPLTSAHGSDTGS